MHEFAPATHGFVVRSPVPPGESPDITTQFPARPAVPQTPAEVTLRPAVPYYSDINPSEPSASSCREPLDPRLPRARFYEKIGLTSLNLLIRTTTVLESTRTLARDLRKPDHEKEWVAGIDENERRNPPGLREFIFKWREGVIYGQALGRYAQASGTYDLLETMHLVQPGTEVAMFVAPPGAKDRHSKAIRVTSDALNDLVFGGKDMDKAWEVKRDYWPYRKNDVRFLAATYHKAERRNPPRSDPTAALRMIGPVYERDMRGRKKIRVPHSVRMLQEKFGVDPEESLRNTHFPDGESLPQNLEEFYKNAWDIVLTGMDTTLAERGGRLDVRVQMAEYKAALQDIQEYARRHGITHTQYIIGVMDVDTIYDSLHSRGDQDWVEADGVVRQTVMSRKPGSNISTFAIGRISAEDPANKNHWEGHLGSVGPNGKPSRWYRYFFGDELTDRRKVEIIGMDTPATPARWKQLKVVQTVGAVWKGAAADFESIKQEKGRVRAALLAGQLALTTAVTVPYLFGGLESTMGTVSTEVLKHGGNIIEIALAGGATSTVAELTLTALFTGCLKYFKQAAAALEQHKYEKPEYSKTGTALLAIGTRSPGIMLRSAVHTPDANHTLAGAKTAAMLFPVGATASGLIVGGALNVAPEWIVEAAVDPRTWLGAVAVVKGVPYLIKTLKAHRAQTKAARQEMLSTPPVQRAPARLF